MYLLYHRLSIIIIFVISFISASTIEILYNTNEQISGFQFSLTNATITGTTAGENVPNDWMISASATTVIGFSLSGTTIPAGSGVLVYVDIEGVAEDACLDAVVLSNSSGNSINNEVIDCVTISQITTISGCTNETACNFNPDANDDDGSCEFSEEYFDCDGCLEVVLSFFSYFQDIR